jgi:hypothetical protein
MWVWMVKKGSKVAKVRALEGNISVGIVKNDSGGPRFDGSFAQKQVGNG